MKITINRISRLVRHTVRFAWGLLPIKLINKIYDNHPPTFAIVKTNSDYVTDTGSLKSCICTQKQLESSPMQYWAERLGEKRERLHRKLWEWCFIIQALYERKLLQPGISGLGFAVGKEPLASLFCSYGTTICATDIYTDIAKDLGWVDSNQHASSFESLNLRKLCPEELFYEKCNFRNIDMNSIPNDAKDFDFIWSSCALEHLGSLKHGEQFIYNAMNCIKPGGFAVHTTEYNFSSNGSTVESGSTVLYRQQDIENIISNLQADGHSVEMVYTKGTLAGDVFIDTPPYSHNPHLKLRLGRYVVTSLGLIIQKKFENH